MEAIRQKNPLNDSLSKRDRGMTFEGEQGMNEKIN